MGELVKLHDHVTYNNDDVTPSPCATEGCPNVAKHHLGPMREDRFAVLHLCRECAAITERHYSRIDG